MGGQGGEASKEIATIRACRNGRKIRNLEIFIEQKIPLAIHIISAISDFLLIEH